MTREIGPWRAAMTPWRRAWLRFERLARRLARERRTARLARDPVLRVHPEGLRRGEHWSDESIAYHGDPGRLATLGSLRPVEAGMRAQGLDLRLSFRHQVTAPCLVDAAALERQASFVSVRLETRWSKDGPEARLSGDVPGSMIWVEHPAAAPMGTPVFPLRQSGGWLREAR